MYGKILLCLIVVIQQSTSQYCSNECLQVSEYDSSTCTQCIPGTVLVGGNCCNCPNYCNSCYLGTEGDILCSACATGFNLSEYSCGPNGCSSYSGLNYQCQSCYEGYSLFNKSCFLCNISNCQSCIGNSVCGVCSSGYNLTQGMCPPNYCTTYNGLTNTCTTCLSGYLLSNGLCFTCDIYNCQSCSDDNVCGACQSGFYFDSGSCPPNGCSSYDSSSNYCEACNTGYSLSSGSCFLCSVSNCQSCTGNNVCGVCSSGYVKNGSICSAPSVCSVSNCMSCSTVDNYVCSVCNQGYYIESGYCNYCSIPNCQSCVSSNECGECDQYYFLNDGVCTYQFSTSSSSTSSLNLGLILGVSIPLGVGVILAISFVIYRRKKVNVPNQDIVVDPTIDSTREVKENFELNSVQM